MNNHIEIYEDVIPSDICNEFIEKFETAEKAAEGKDGQFVEVKLNDVKIEFNKVRREDDESQKGTPEAERQGTKKI